MGIGPYGRTNTIDQQLISGFARQKEDANMKSKKKLIFLCLLLVMTVAVLAGCGDPNPYQVNDGMNHTVSIQYDANGGSFTSVNSPVLVDSYDITGLKTNAAGMVELPLLNPAHESRGDDAKNAQKNGYFLVGWYQERTEVTDANGNKTYTYAKPWDFENGRVSVDPGKDYTAKEPVLTLYAAWAPLFEIEYYALGSDEAMKTVTINPNEGLDVKVPVWNEETGALDMKDFPEKEGYTFTAAYYDSQKTQAVDTETVTHPGVINKDDATVSGGKLKLYLDWKEGKWFKITTAQQFIKAFSPSGCYEILADLDFTGKTWPTTLMYGNFTGTIQGNGHTISNVELKQTSNNKMNCGLFGTVAEGACLENITFENITFSVEAGTRLQGAAYGLFAGSVSENANVQNVMITGSLMQIHAGANLNTVSLGLISGYGDAGLDSSGITCVAVNKQGEETVIVADESGMVSVTFDMTGNLITEQIPEETPEQIPADPQE